MVCTTPATAITITVAALVASSGTVTATPTPVNAGSQTVLTAQFKKSAAATGNPGAPSGAVTFAAGTATIPPAPLVLDTTATFASQTSAIIGPATALEFQVPPSDTALNTAITPAVQVALVDSTSTVAIGSTAAVTIALAGTPDATLAERRRYTRSMALPRSPTWRSIWSEPGTS